MGSILIISIIYQSLELIDALVQFDIFTFEKGDAFVELADLRLGTHARIR